uniref:Uncharacterized protein n=1 Tax=Chlorobium phaeobacteroides (strain BS1) TaxID=331678 RepID=B3EQP8_CHLPB
MNFITIVQSSFRVILGPDPRIHLFLDRMHGCRIKSGMTILNGLSVILGLDPWIHLFLDRVHGCRITPVKSEHLFHRS